MNTEFPGATQEISLVELNNVFEPIERQSRLRKTLPFIIGAGAAVAGTLLIRAWIKHAKNKEVEEVEEPSETSPAITAKSIAFQLLPFATLFFKNWLTKRKTTNAEVIE